MKLLGVVCKFYRTERKEFMRKIVLILGLILFQSCWICPDRHKIEFDNDEKIFTVLSDGFFIESVKMTEYIQKEGYIETIDSNSITIASTGKQLQQNINLKSLTKNYSVVGIDLKKMLEKKNIAFEVWVKNSDLKVNDENAKSLVYFVTDNNSKGKTIQESNGCK
ncbi:hypothetical protein [Flavobacterium sp. 3HN19-14]|uniref:hypothetical protein n=1 Tax=Flavobacterium sp. 3HN19-14 TaxID=3448133 RepID=UPI003EDF2F6C